MITSMQQILGALPGASAVAALVAAAGFAAPNLGPDDCQTACQTQCEQAGAVLPAGSLELRPQVAPDGVMVVRAVSAQPEGKVTTEQHTYIKVVQKDDSGAYELIIEDGQPQATVNGKAVSKKQIKQVEDGVWVICDEHGEPLTKFHVGAAGPGAITVWTGDDDVKVERKLNVAPQMRLHVQPDVRFSPQDFAFATTQGEPPKTMLGVVMIEPPQAVAEHLGVDGGKAVLLDRVIEGLPASAAGLESGDIIIKVEGAPDASAEAIRKVLREKAPGDELKVHVLRHGEKKSFAIKLKAFDAAKLGRAETATIEDFQFTPEQQTWLAVPGGQVSGLSAETRKQMEHALQALKEAEKQATGEARKAQQQARKAIEQFVNALEQMEKEGLTTSDAMRGDLGHWFRQFDQNDMVLGDKPGMVFTLPKQNFAWRNQDGNFEVEVQTESDESAAGEIRKTEDTDARLQALSERLERIEKLLEKLTRDNN